MSEELDDVTDYKRWSCHSGLKLLCKLCRTSPPPAVGARFKQSTTHGNAPKGSGSYLRPKTHIHNISVQAHKPLQIIKALTATGWGKQKETLMATYKAVMRPALEYASSVWSPIASSTSINKLQVMQNAALRTATGCTQDTNIQHLHDETLTLPIHEHLQLHASQYKQKTQHPSHHLHKHTTYFNTPRLKKNTIFNNGRYTKKHSHRPPHSHYNRQKNKHAPYTHIYCL